MSFASEKKKHNASGYVSNFGRSYKKIECPFCHCVVRAYIWSLAGTGKRCGGCKAIHYHYGYSIKRS